MTRFFKLRVGRELVPLIITSPSAVTALVGTAPLILLMANHPNVSWAIISGSGWNLDPETAILTRADDSVAGVFSCVVRVTDIETDRTADATITFTLTAAPSLGKVLNLAYVSRTKNSISMSWSLLAGATGYQLEVNGSGVWLPFTTTLLNGTAHGLQPGTEYDFRVRGTDGSIFGTPSDTLTQSTLDDTDPPVDPNYIPVRCIELTDKPMMQMYLTRRTSDPYTAYRTGDSQDTGAYDTSGWLMGHFAPLAQVGLKHVRSVCGSPDNTTNMTVQIIRKLFDDFGVRFHVTLNDIKQFSGSAVGAEEVIERAYRMWRNAAKSFAGVNEPNSPKDPMFNPRPGSTDGWRGYVIDHQYIINREIRNTTKYPNWPTDLEIHSWSPWTRLIKAIRSVLYEGYVHTKARADVAGVMFHDVFPPYTNPNGRQWIRDCLPLVDRPNLHLYTGGNMPDWAGETDGLLDENGDPDINIHITKLLAQYSELVNLDPTKKTIITENGYELGGTDGRSFTLRFLTEEARSKFYQRALFDYHYWGIMGNCIFEFLDNASELPDVPNSPGKVYGLVSFNQAGANNYTFTRRPLWYIYYLTMKAMFDPGATARTFTKSNLVYAFGDAGTAGQFDVNTRWMLHQRSDGKHLLPVWYNHQSWKRKPTYSNQFASRDIRLTLATPKVIRYTRPYVRAMAMNENLQWTTVNGGSPTTTVDFTNYDDVTIFEIG